MNDHDIVEAFTFVVFFLVIGIIALVAYIRSSERRERHRLDDTFQHLNNRSWVCVPGDGKDLWLRYNSIDPSALHVVAWNVLADELAQTGNFDATPPRALEWLGRSRRAFRLAFHSSIARFADVIGLVELTHLDEWRQAAAERGFVMAVVDKKSATPHSVALFVRHDRVRVVEAIVDDSPRETKCVAFAGAIVELNDTRWFVGVTHLKAKLLNESVRIRQTKVIAGIVARKLAQHDKELARRVVIMGDMNTEPRSSSLISLANDLDVRSALVDGDPTTCKSRFGEVSLRHIDHVFAHNSARVIARVESARLDGSVLLPGDEVFPSDHVPVGAAIMV